MTFSADIARFKGTVDERARRLHRGVSEVAFTSIVRGSPITGAPGQPVDVGTLRTSWQQRVHGPLTDEISTNVIYAPQIEDGTRNGRQLVLRSQVGGFHSVKLTVAAWPRIVEHVARLVTSGR